MNLETLENKVNNFLKDGMQKDFLSSLETKIDVEKFLCDQLIKSFKILEDSANW